MESNDIVARLRDCTCVPHGEICREAADEIERLRAERDEARHGESVATATLQGVIEERTTLRAERDRKNLTIQALTEERDELVRMANKLTDERDEARRMYCEEAFCHRFNERGGEATIIDSRQIAHSMGWDCFKEGSND